MPATENQIKTQAASRPLTFVYIPGEPDFRKPMFQSTGIRIRGYSQPYLGCVNLTKTCRIWNLAEVVGPQAMVTNKSNEIEAACPLTTRGVQGMYSEKE